MNRKSKDAIEWAVAITLFVLCIKVYVLSYGDFSAVEAHRQSERTVHYGPSQIIKEIEFDNQKLFLCRYKEWFSLDQINKKVIMWYPGGGVMGRKIKENEKMTYSRTTGNARTDNSKETIKLFGYVNDDKIKNIVLETNNAEKSNKKYELDESRMFIFYWFDEVNGYMQWTKLKGIDKNGYVVC